MNLKSLVACAVFIATVFGCGTSPEDPPAFRVKNENTDKVSIQIKTSGGSTLNINDVDPGIVTPYQTTAEGKIEVTGSVQKDTTKATSSFIAANNKSYTIKVLNTTPTSISVVSP